jgi:hypothetical protein
MQRLVEISNYRFMNIRELKILFSPFVNGPAKGEALVSGVWTEVFIRHWKAGCWTSRLVKS